MKTNKIYNENCLETLKRMPDNYLSAIVTDPPYGLSFMGKSWDYDVPSVDIWRECLRVLKPGGHLLAFAGTRTQHRMAVNIEDAGFEIRDMIAWVYGSGFPKSLNVGKAVDELQGNEREVVGKEKIDIGMQSGSMHSGRSVNVIERDKTKGNSEWEGYGTSLKPSLEPITVARKPFKGSVAQNVLEYGTGAINIDGCRVATNDAPRNANKEKSNCKQTAYGKGWQKSGTTPSAGRFPANLIHDGSDEVTGLFPETTSGNAVVGTGKGYAENASGIASTGKIASCFADSGSAARFFYCAKASKDDRGDHNTHPTVKPIKLMRYLIKLVTPPNGIIYDPFMGSGTTAIAAHEESVEWIGSELSPEYHKIATERVKKKTAQQKLF